MLGILERDADLRDFILKQNAVIVDATEATNWFYEESDQEDWSLADDMHRLTGPGVNTWIEFQAPRFSLSPDGPSAWKNGIQRIGAHVICAEIKEEERARAIAGDALGVFFCHVAIGGEFGEKMYQVNRGREDLAQDRAILRESGILPRFILGVRIYALLNGRIERAISVHAMYLTEDGKAYPRDLKAASFRYSLNASMAMDAGALDIDQVHDLLNSMFLPFAFTLSLMNCRNVVLSEPEVVHSRSERRRLEREHSQPVAYRWLRIGQLQRQAEGDAEAKHPGKGRKRRLHQVRAHWAHYDADAPLFGRPGLVGTFFRPQSLRGRAEVGEVKKGYRPVPSKEN